MYKIREYSEKDKSQLIELWINVAVEEHEFKEWRDEISELNENEYEKILVATFEDKIIGSIAYKTIDDNIAELKRVYVYKEHRGSGIAKKLYNEILILIKQNKYKKIFVETWKNFESGRKFYEKNGFILQNIQGEVYNYILEL